MQPLMPVRRLGVLVLLLVFIPTLSSLAQEIPGATRVPTLWIIGDSTVKTPTRGQQGWGDPINAFFDPAKVHIENKARGGRSSRTYRTEGLWNEVREQLRPGDFVLIQFGHNDGGPLDSGRARASLKGNGEETRTVVDPRTKADEMVHTYGWYLRRYASEAKEKGATPIVLSPIPRNIWKDDGKTVVRASGDYGKWAGEAARAESVPFIDLNERIARRYEELGPDKVKTTFFGVDHTHTTPAGAELNAAEVASGILRTARLPPGSGPPPGSGNRREANQPVPLPFRSGKESERGDFREA